jgi:hypothetical protein
MKCKIKWVVQPPEKGLAAVAYRRGWPTAEYEDGEPAGRLEADAHYHHLHKGIIYLYVADHTAKTEDGRPTFNWKRAKQTFTTIPEAKLGLIGILERNPQLRPEKYRG